MIIDIEVLLKQQFNYRYYMYWFMIKSPGFYCKDKILRMNLRLDSKLFLNVDSLYTKSKSVLECLCNKYLQ